MGKTLAERLRDCGNDPMWADHAEVPKSWCLAAADALDRITTPDAEELPFDRDTLGRMVREAWVRWAKTQPAPKPSWLVAYDDLTEPDKEADRQIGEAIAKWTMIGVSARANSPALSPPEGVVASLQPRCQHCNDTGFVAINAATGIYIRPGPVPDDARGVAETPCWECLAYPGGFDGPTGAE